jgi:hypothetical protein
MNELLNEQKTILKDLLSLFVLIHYIAVNFIETLFGLEFRKAYLDNSAAAAGVVFVYHYGVSSIIFIRYLLKYYKIVQTGKIDKENA